MNRLLSAFPTARPWRDRAREDPLAMALIQRDATDAEAADVFAAQCAEMREALRRAIETQPAPIVHPMDYYRGPNGR